MSTKFLEPGGDSTFNVATPTTGGFWTTVTNAPAIATDFVHGSHLTSIRFLPNIACLARASSIYSNAGRFSFYIYLVALPSATANMISFLDATTSVRIRLTSAGVLQLWESSVQIGSDGSTLSTGVWYRISFAFTTTDTTHNRFELFVNGKSDISVTDATITNVAITAVLLGNGNANSTFDYRTSDHYADDSSSLVDTGDIWVTAKRPVSNGTANQFTTQIGSGGSGYGSGHSPQVNERIISTTNGWSLSNTTQSTEEYNIEAKNVGDIDITNSTIVDYVGWILANVNSTADSPVHNIIINGASTAKTMTTTATMYTQPAGSSTYPAGTGTDIGMDAQYTTTPHLTRLFECGIMVAYIPRGSMFSVL